MENRLVNKMEKYAELVSKLSKYRYFAVKTIQKSDIILFNRISEMARLDILKMTAISGSGHLGGSFSTIDLYLLLWLCADIDREKIASPERDIIIISIGHTSAAAYVALGIYGFIELDDAIYNFRTGKSIFEGQLGNKVPGIEWSSGDLGQGLSVGCGYALALKKKGIKNRVFVVMGDGEQQKGQIAEAIRFAKKYNLDNLIAIVDSNRLQATGRSDDIMPNNIEGNYNNSGWKVEKADGHDFALLYRALRDLYFSQGAPKCLIADTKMCRGLEGFEDMHESHGLCLLNQEYEDAIKKFDIEPGLVSDYLDIGRDTILKKRNDFTGRLKKTGLYHKTVAKNIEKSIKVRFLSEYPAGQMISGRDVFGETILQIGKDNNPENDVLPIMVIDCDLKVSVKTDKFEKCFPQNFIQAGIAEHNAVGVAGAFSKAGFLTFFADFGVFAVDEVYNQLRLNDINDTSLKLICTHTGIEVGEDGKSHHCLDYISLMSNLFNFKIVMPADANHIVHITNYISSHPGNFMLVLNRSKTPVLADENIKPFFGSDYIFKYGSSDWLKKGSDGTIITYGHMTFRALEAAEALSSKHGIKAGVLNISSLPHLDTDKIFDAAQSTENIIVYEDHNINTGLGTIIGSFIAENSLDCSFKKMGVLRYGLSADTEYQYSFQGLGVEGLVKNITNSWK